MENRPIYDSDYTTDAFSRLDCCRVFTDPNYRSPTSDEIRMALKIGGLTGGQAAKLLGVSTVGGSRTVRKWTGGEREIPYSAWRLLLILIGVVSVEASKAIGHEND